MSIELDLLRPALERAVAVARAGLDQVPPVEPPRSLAPLLRFRRLPSRALAAARHAVDDDETFRARVADGADEAILGRAAWLFLIRPDGWSDEIAELIAEVEAEQAADRSRSDDRTVEKLGKQVQDLRRRVAEVDAARHAESQRAATALDRVAAMKTALSDQEAALAAAEAARQRAVRELKDVEKRLADRTAEVKELQAALDERDRGDASAATAAATAAHDLRARVDSATADSALVDSIRAKWDELGPALTEVGRLLSIPDQDPARLLRKAQTAGVAERVDDAPRLPPLPPRIVSGSPDALRWYLSRPGVTVFVDGYNVTMLAWPDLNASEQRVALERAGRRLQAQLGCRIVLVFDGEEDGGREVRSSVGSPVRVLFTPASVEADDEILAQLDSRTGPAVVVSNDRRVQDGSEERGAVVIRTDEFLPLIR